MTQNPKSRSKPGLVYRGQRQEGEAVAPEPGSLDLLSRYVKIEQNFTAGHLEDSPKNGRRREVDLAGDLGEVPKTHLAMQEAEAALAGHPRPTGRTP